MPAATAALIRHSTTCPSSHKCSQRCQVSLLFLLVYSSLNNHSCQCFHSAIRRDHAVPLSPTISLSHTHTCTNTFIVVTDHVAKKHLWYFQAPPDHCWEGGTGKGWSEAKWEGGWNWIRKEKGEEC